MINDKNHNWQNLKKNGLLDSVRDLNDYERKVEDSMLIARGFFQTNTVTVPEPYVWLQAHKLLFHLVSPSAGEFRTPGLTVFGNRTAVDSSRIIPELELLKAQTTLILNNAQTPQQIMAGFAFCHARMEHIHPFDDGNGRTGRMMLVSQLDSVFGFQDRPSLDRPKYIEGLNKAYDKGDLTDLTNLLLKREGLPPLQESIIAPYRVTPCMDDGKKYSIDEELTRTVDFHQKRFKEIEPVPEPPKKKWKWF